jgi:hypothetical protein
MQRDVQYDMKAKKEHLGQVMHLGWVPTNIDNIQKKISGSKGSKFGTAIMDVPDTVSVYKCLILFCVELIELIFTNIHDNLTHSPVTLVLPGPLVSNNTHRTNKTQHVPSLTKPAR